MTWIATAACGSSSEQFTATAIVAQAQTRAAAPTETPTLTSTPTPTLTPAPTNTPTPTHTATPSNTPTVTPTIPLGWEAYTASNLSLLLPDEWTRLTEHESSTNPFVSDPLFVASSPTGDVQITMYCMTRAEFGSTFQVTPSTPNEAGGAIWDHMFSYFLYFDLQDRLNAELVADITVAGHPGAMALFTSPGVGSNLGVENPMELQPAQETYYKELINFLPEQHVCYIIVTAKTNTARAGNELAAIIDSITFTP